MSYGFVYLLRNEYMPDVYKVGQTERSPHQRAEELSRATGVPAPFSIVCFIEVRDCQSVERHLHHWFKQYRISPDREFFHHGLIFFLEVMYHLPGRLSFTVVDGEFLGQELDRAALHSVENLNDPWHKPDAPTEAAATTDEPIDSQQFSPALKLVGSDGFE